MKDGGPAFPCPGSNDGSYRYSAQVGLTVRDLFALSMMITRTLYSGHHGDYKDFASQCYEQADAMLSEREKRKEG